jgi:hypothetical protein
VCAQDQAKETAATGAFFSSDRISGQRDKPLHKNGRIETVNEGQKKNKKKETKKKKYLLSKRIE